MAIPIWYIYDQLSNARGTECLLICSTKFLWNDVLKVFEAVVIWGYVICTPRITEFRHRSRFGRVHRNERYSRCITKFRHLLAALPFKPNLKFILIIIQRKPVTLRNLLCCPGTLFIGRYCIGGAR